MSEGLVQLIVRVVDQATAELTKIKNTVGKFASSVANSFTPLKLALGAALGALATPALIRNIENAQNTAVRLDVAYRNLGKNLGYTRQQLDEFASEMQRLTTIDDETVKSAEAMLLTFDRVRGQAFEKTLKVAADLSSALGTDMVSATRLLGRALQEPGEGMQGLVRLGVKLTGAQAAQIKAMNEAGDAAGAQAKLLDILRGKYEGTAQAAAGTLGGALKQLQNAFTDLLELDAAQTQGPVKALQDLKSLLEDPAIREGVARLVKAFIDSFGQIAKIIAGVVVVLKKMGLVAETDPVKIIDMQIGKLAFRLKELNANPISRAFNKDEIRKIREEMRLLGEQQQKVLSQPRAAGGGLTAAPGIPELAAVTVTGAGPKAIAREEERLRKLRQEFKDAVAQERLLQQGVAEGLGPALAEVGDSLANLQADNAFDALDASAKKLSATLQEELVTETEARLELLRNAIGGIQSAFNNLFIEGIKGAKSFLRAMLQVFQQIMAQAATMNLMKALGLGGGGGGWLGKLLGPLIGSAAGGTVTPRPGHMIGLAGGGRGSGLAMVGEEGPELLMLPGGSRVYNQRQLAAAGGGGLSYAPHTSISISGAQNDRDLEARLAVLIARNNAEQREEMARLLTRNRFGRLR